MSVAVRDARVGHAEHVRLVELQLRVELVDELVSGAAAARAVRVAGLDHEAVDDPVEDHPVVERTGRLTLCVACRVLLGAVGQADEVRHGLGRVIREEVDPDVTPRSVQGGRDLNSNEGSIAVCHLVIVPSEQDRSGRGRIGTVR
jgi:hypothetical protein